MSERYFDIERDKLFPYFCLGCLIGKTAGEYFLHKYRNNLSCGIFQLAVQC